MVVNKNYYPHPLVFRQRVFDFCAKIEQVS